MSKFDRVRWEVSTAIALARLRSLGITLGEGGRFLGQPIVTRHVNSSISIGDRLVATSQSRGTALGVRGPVIFRTLADGASLSIGEDNGMSGTVICAAKSIQIGSRCLFGADTMIFDTDFHGHERGDGEDVAYRRYRPVDWDLVSSPVIIGDDVFLGARVVVAKGVTIGDGSIIAANSVVSRSIPANCVAAGSPAKVVRRL